MSNPNTPPRPASLAATRAILTQKFGEVRPDNVAVILHTIANDWAKVAIHSVNTEPARFHALTGAAEMVTAIALALEDYTDALLDAQAAAAEYADRDADGPADADPEAVEWNVWTGHGWETITARRCTECGHRVAGPDTDRCPMHVPEDYYADPADVEPVPMCEYFALCDRPADGVYAHPVIGDVPTCERCAAVVGLGEGRPWRRYRDALDEALAPLAAALDRTAYLTPDEVVADGFPECIACGAEMTRVGQLCAMCLGHDIPGSDRD